MTDKELEIKAEEYAEKQQGVFRFLSDHIKFGFLAGAKELEKENQQLKEQIEKMKNWCNCKNYQECLIELAAQGKGMKPSECCVNCKKWELKESKRISE